MERVVYQPIGIIHTWFTQKEDTPIQGIFAKDARGEVKVFSEYTAGLKDVGGFSHLTLIYHFHLSEGYTLVAKPFMDDEERGVFSIRHFRRPNPIGLSIVKLDQVNGNTLRISEVDIIDGTPLLDIKPYVDQFDNRNDIKSGWVSNPHLEVVKEKSWEALKEQGFKW
ncbi:MAG: tRNA (N6-threonylcarbamoyladenosine(37)-N6)-methyltransferase TrmO [Chloroflexota bacterium]|nr:tRNA (N6-threonylcarbamoyladenosine(37)-N6)-methyltransferase TrmO [Chloroflexota bacterium]